MGRLSALAWSSMVSVSAPSSKWSIPSANPYPSLFLPNFELAPLEVDGLVARLPPAPTLRARTIKSFIRMTSRKIGRRSGTKGEGCRATSDPSDGIGLYGSTGSGRDLVAMMMYCQVQPCDQATSLDESEGTHVRVYERENHGIRKAVSPIARERGWHTWRIF